MSAIEEQVGLGPDRIALRVAEQSHTYAELWRAAGGIAASLGPRPGRVGLVFRREFPTYAAYLGILRAGGTVLPIGPRWPEKRVREVLDTAAPATVVVDGDAADPAAYAGARLLSAARHAEGLSPAGGMRGDARRRGIRAVHVGLHWQTQGVPVDHRALRAYLAHVIDRYELGHDCRMAQAADLTFDASVFEILAAWTAGPPSSPPPGGRGALPSASSPSTASPIWTPCPRSSGSPAGCARSPPGPFPTCAGACSAVSSSPTMRPRRGARRPPVPSWRTTTAPPNWPASASATGCPTTPRCGPRPATAPSPSARSTRTWRRSSSARGSSGRRR
ncbi:AMP-binding protein [Streptomyces albus]|nr:AMP-binding protein [Streptomyces albus]